MCVRCGNYSKKLGYSWVSSRPEHPKGDAAVREAFKKKVCDQIRQIRTDNPGKKLEIWFQDEARFGRQGTLCRQWALKGTRLHGWRQTQFEYLYVLGAACPQTGQSVGLITPGLNTDSVNAFLREFEKETSPDVHVVMIWDQAGFHTCKNLTLPRT